MGMETNHWRLRGFNVGIVAFATASLMVLTASWPSIANAGTRCPDVEISGSMYKVGVVEVDCETASRVIQKFFVRYEEQTGIKQIFWVEGFRCGRASGTLGCQNKSGTKAIFAGGHIGDKPWTWKPTPPISKIKRNCGVPKWSKIRHGGKLTTTGGVTCHKANKVTRRYLVHIQEADPYLNGWTCGGGSTGRGDRFYLDCTKGERAIRWRGNYHAIYGNTFG